MLDSTPQHDLGATLLALFDRYGLIIAAVLLVYLLWLIVTHEWETTGAISRKTLLQGGIVCLGLVAFWWVIRVDFGGVLAECGYHAKRFNTDATWKVGVTDFHCEFKREEILRNMRRGAENEGA